MGPQGLQAHLLQTGKAIAQAEVEVHAGLVPGDLPHVHRGEELGLAAVAGVVGTAPFDGGLQVPPIVVAALSAADQGQGLALAHPL